MNMLEKIVAKVGPENIKRNSTLGRLVSSHGVSRSGEFLRIAGLPRRVWESDPVLPELIELLSDDLRAPGGKMKLWPQQAQALRDCYNVQGLFAPIAVGRGKALVSVLAPVVMEAKRPLLIVPASLRDQTLRKVIPEMRRHWRLHPHLRVIGYSEISLAHRKDLLWELNPDLLILDEAHYLKNANAARTKRVKRYLLENPTTRVLCLSGTMSRKSLRDYWQLMLWALGEENAPLPCRWREMSDWADAIDLDVEATKRVQAGALATLCEPGEELRHGFRRRIVETPGVVATSEEELGVSLRILPFRCQVPRHVLGMLERLRTDWVAPNGDEIVEAIDLYRVARELALGFWYKWNPAPPADWLVARKAWKTWCRDTLRNNRRELDSELQVWNECHRKAEAGELGGDHPYYDWLRLKDTFDINTEAVWEDEFAIKAAALWLNDQENGGGICWVEHIAFGERLAEYSGLPYFGAGEKASREILDVEGPIIASIVAHSEGKNLQRWSRNLVVSPPSSGKRWEQMLGRTHREGQQADEVEVFCATFVDEHLISFRKAMDEAKYIQDTIGARQKLMYADVAFDWRT
jgi:hypothetical protein